MEKPTESVFSSGSFEATLMGRLTRLGCWQAGKLSGQAEGHHQGPRQKLQNWQIIAGFVAQCLHTGGSLQHLISRYFTVRLSSSALSQRRQHMQFEPFATVMRHALRPMAQQQIHTDCFFAGLPLVGIDGTQFDLLNTPQIKRRREQGEDAAWGGGLWQALPQRAGGTGHARAAGILHATGANERKDALPAALGAATAGEPHDFGPLLRAGTDARRVAAAVCSSRQPFFGAGA
jgi:hypothetical protein